MPHGFGAGTAQAIFLDRFRFVQESLNRIRNYVEWDNGAVAVTEASEPGRRRAKALGWLIWLSLVGVPKLVPCLTWHTELRQFAMRNFCDRYLIPWLGAVSVRVPVLLDGVPQVLGPAPDDAQWLAPLLSVLESLATGHVQASQVRRSKPKLTTVDASELQWDGAAAPWTLAECVVLYELLLRRLDRLALDCLKSLQRDVYSNATNNDGNVDDLHSSYRQTNLSPLESPGRSAAKKASRLGRQPALSASVEGTTLKRENSAVFDAEIRDRWKRHQGPSRQPIHPTACRSDCRHEAEADAPASAALGNEANTMNGSGHSSSNAVGLYESVPSGADGMESLPGVWTPSALDGANALENAAPYAHALLHNIGVLVWQLVTGVETCLPVHDGTLANTLFTPETSARHAHSSQQCVTEGQVLEESVSVAPKSNPHRHMVTARAQRKRPPERLIKTSKQQTSTAGKQNSSDPSIGMLDGWRFPLARRSAYGHLAAVLALLRQIRDSDGALAACVAHRSTSSSAVSMLRRLLEIWQSESNHAGVAALSPHLSTMQNADTDTAELSMNLETLYAVLIAILRGAAHEFGHHLLQIRSHQAASSSTGNGDGLVEETRSLQQHLEQLLCDVLRTSEHRNLRDSAGINRTSSGSIGHNNSLVPMLQTAILGVQAIMSQLEEQAAGPARQKRESHHLTDIVSESTMPGLLPALQERNASADSASALATPSTRVHRRQDNSAKHPIAQVLLQIAERRGVDAFLAAFDRFAAKAQSRWLETLEAILRTQRPSDRGIWPTVTWYRALFELGCVMNTAARVDGKRLLEAFWSHCAPCPVLDEQCDPAMLVAALRSYLNGFATERSVYPGMSSAQDESSEGGELPDLRQLTEALLSRLAANAYRPRKAPQEASWSVADSLFMNALAPTLRPPCAWSAESSAFGSQVNCVETGSARGHSQPWFAAIEEFALWIPMSSLARSLQQHIRTGLLSLSANHTDAETFTEQCTWLVDVLQAVDRGLATQNAFCRSSASSIEVEPQQCPLFDECFVNQLACGCEPQLRADSPPEATVSRSMTNPTARHGSSKRCHGTREVVLALAERLTSHDERWSLRHSHLATLFWRPNQKQQEADPNGHGLVTSCRRYISRHDRFERALFGSICARFVFGSEPLQTRPFEPDV
ncbi:hypothetical protein F1559_002150 [Cyanidiococcus yangmingshanensis]|uniref:Uncharacterized protein n=1 Tax=Cyanidiococcus yangmingshanensis TaxID=2690220 RepID=A0A7J7IJF3_9RHOD|nr:hypothetical protein F1559_002150 [Cyanidiococcus yangmingshanensis]